MPSGFPVHRSEAVTNHAPACYRMKGAVRSRPLQIQNQVFPDRFRSHITLLSSVRQVLYVSCRFRLLFIDALELYQTEIVNKERPVNIILFEMHHGQCFRSCCSRTG